LPSSLDSEALRQIFSTYGQVMHCRVLASTVSDGKCAALVRFVSVEEAKQVKESLSGATLPGFDGPLSVRFAEAPESRASKEGGRGGFKCSNSTTGIETIACNFETSGALPGGRGHSEGNQHALYIAGLPPDTANVHLYKLFASFGAIRPKGVHAMMNPDGTCKGIAFVNFLEASAAQAAIMMYNGAVLPDGTTLKVAMKMSKSDGSRNAVPKAPVMLPPWPLPLTDAQPCSAALADPPRIEDIKSDGSAGPAPAMDAA